MGRVGLGCLTAALAITAASCIPQLRGCGMQLRLPTAVSERRKVAEVRCYSAGTPIYEGSSRTDPVRLEDGTWALIDDSSGQLIRWSGDCLVTQAPPSK